MIEDGVVSLIFIRFVIVAVRAVAPLCAAYLALAYTYHEWASLPLIAYALLELSFYLFVYLPRSHQLQEVPFLFIKHTWYSSKSSFRHTSQLLPPEPNAASFCFRLYKPPTSKQRPSFLTRLDGSSPQTDLLTEKM